MRKGGSEDKAEVRGMEKKVIFFSLHLEVGDFPGDGLAEFGQGIRVLTDGDHVVVSDGGEALVVQQLLLDLGQAGLKLQLIAHVCVGSNEDDRRQRSYSLEREFIQRLYEKMDDTSIVSVTLWWKQPIILQTA